MGGWAYMNVFNQPAPQNGSWKLRLKLENQVDKYHTTAMPDPSHFKQLRFNNGIIAAYKFIFIIFNILNNLWFPIPLFIVNNNINLIIMFFFKWNNNVNMSHIQGINLKRNYQPHNPYKPYKFIPIIENN